MGWLRTKLLPVESDAPNVPLKAFVTRFGFSETGPSVLTLGSKKPKFISPDWLYWLALILENKKLPSAVNEGKFKPDCGIGSVLGCRLPEGAAATAKISKPFSTDASNKYVPSSPVVVIATGAAVDSFLIQTLTPGIAGSSPLFTLFRL
ncbi:hypothetical protein FQZ97_1014000 [compost metagenome]